MKINLKSVLLWVGMSLIISGPCALAHTDVTAEKARELIDSTADLMVIDVREPSEYSDTGGHIPGALNYPWYSGVLPARYEELPMDGPVLVVCGSGSRSHQAAKFLDSKDFSMVYDMQAGMSAWIWETETGVDTNIKYGGGTGEPNDPYQIATAEDLILLGETPEDYDKHFILTADIDLDPNLPGGKVFDRAVIAPDTNDAELEFQGTPFNGVFNGNGYAISNLHVQGGNYLGLFGKIDLIAKVSNLGLEAINIKGGGEHIGSLVGWNEGNITMSYSAGTVSGIGMNVGGLVGFNLGSITTSHSGCEVSGTISVGGLVGYNVGDLTGCYSTAVVSGYLHVGGLVGYSQNGSITTSYSSGTTTGGMSAGGLAGWNWGGVISKCYSTGTVTGNSDVGGLLGSDAEGNVTHCYSTGTVSGDSRVGGLLGYGIDSYVTNCFWDTQTSGQTTSAGGTGKTTAEMQTASTFLEVGWDFVDESANGTEDIWSICEGTNYPRFVWQIPAGDFVCPDGITIDDFLFFMEHWLNDNCDSSNGYCEGTDLDKSGTVDVIDLEIFFENWSAGK